LSIKQDLQTRPRKKQAKTTDLEQSDAGECSISY
jgi:hypothetical protein